MSSDEIKETLRLHLLFVLGDSAGVKADLSGADLSWADLRGADLREADLSGADLSGANLSRANLRETDLSWADLSGADLREADLSRANLSGADLREADLSRANLRETDLSGANLRGADLPDGIRIASVSGIGSARRMTTYRADTDEVWCGCFKGTLSEFSAKIEETHNGNPVHLSDYRAVVAMFEAFKTGGAG